MLPLTCASLWRSFSQAVPVEDPWSKQRCPPTWACICIVDQISSVCVSMEKRRDQGSESPPSRQPHLVHFLVSSTYPGHSSQPLSNRRPGSAHWGGWEVLTGLKQSWSGEQSSYSSYMSDCSKWTFSNWSLCPPPVVSLCMGTRVCVHLDIDSSSSLCCV